MPAPPIAPDSKGGSLWSLGRGSGEAIETPPRALSFLSGIGKELPPRQERFDEAEGLHVRKAKYFRAARGNVSTA